MRLKVVAAIASVLIVPLGLLYAQGNSANAPGINPAIPPGGICTAPGHLPDLAHGHLHFQGQGVGHSCHDVTPS